MQDFVLNGRHIRLHNSGLVSLFRLHFKIGGSIYLNFVQLPSVLLVNFQCYYIYNQIINLVISVPYNHIQVFFLISCIV